MNGVLFRPKKEKRRSCVAFWYCHTRRFLVSYFQWWNFYWVRFCFLLSKMLKMWFDYQEVHFGLKFVPKGKILWTLCMDQPARTSVGLVGWTFKDVRHQPKKGVIVATVMDWLGSSTSGCLRDSLKRLVLFCIFWLINIFKRVWYGLDLSLYPWCKRGKCRFWLGFPARSVEQLESVLNKSPGLKEVFFHDLRNVFFDIPGKQRKAKTSFPHRIHVWHIYRSTDSADLLLFIVN